MRKNSILITAILIFSCSSPSLKQNLENINSNCIKYNISGRNYSADEKKYFSYYGFDKINAKHNFGFIIINDYKIALHTFSNKKNKGTVLLLHGYFDHAGVLINLIKYYTDNNYNVVVYDHPGHGLSSGKRADIDNFNTYSNIFNKIVMFTTENFDAPYILNSHSMGCAIASNWILKNPEKSNLFKKIIFLAPMYHTGNWEMSINISETTDGIIEELPRLRRRNSSNEEYRQFSKKDPLQSDTIPTNWFKQVVKWNNEIRNYQPVNKEITVIQGTSDQVVDWKYNIAFIKTIFPQTHINLIPNAGHQIMNETEDYKKLMFKYISETIID